MPVMIRDDLLDLNASSENMCLSVYALNISNIVQVAQEEKDDKKQKGRGAGNAPGPAKPRAAAVKSKGKDNGGYEAIFFCLSRGAKRRLFLRWIRSHLWRTKSS
jgi:hypothetical protein